MAKRESISKKLRFEVFKRDKFTCQYCGSGAPHVVLNVDHINPVANGGKNDILNLVTSCFDCNSGKKDRLLSDDSVVSVKKKQLDILQTKREQLEMMMQWNEELLNIEDQKSEMLQSYLLKLAPGWTLNESGKQSLKKWLQKYEVDEIIMAMNKSCASSIIWTEGKVTRDSFEEAFNKIPAICLMERVGKTDPDLKEFYYIRGILRNRIAYCNPRDTIDWLRAARSWGATLLELKEIALSVRNWTQFSKNISEIIERYKTLDEL